MPSTRVGFYFWCLLVFTAATVVTVVTAVGNMLDILWPF